MKIIRQEYASEGEPVRFELRNATGEEVNP